jgi:FAD/FMN-containing dehydrogenase
MEVKQSDQHDTLELIKQSLGESAVVEGRLLSDRATSYWDPTSTTALALIRPRSTEEVSTVLKICNERRQPIVTQGGLTGCVAGCAAQPNEIILSTERLNTIDSVDRAGKTVSVGAGVVLERLQQQVDEFDLAFPLDLGARGSCTIGGNIATNAGGINVLRYGMMRNLVLGLEVVLANGTILSSMNRMLKNNAGYDLKQLFIGSEGTLGVVTQAVLKLSPKLMSRQTALIALESFETVISLLQFSQRSLGPDLTAFEVMWGDHYRAVTAAGCNPSPMDREHAFYVVIESQGRDLEHDSSRFEATLSAALEQGLMTDATIAQSARQRQEIWDTRDNFEAVLPAYLYDVSLPINAMSAYVSDVQKALFERWQKADCFTLGHIADGNIHFFIHVNEPGDWQEQVNAIVYETLSAFGGSVSAEHGIGMEKKDWLSISRTPEEIETMRLLKSSLDPHHILNPGRML